jgi:hypothetical protein
MTYTIRIDISTCTYLADYFAAKYGSGILSLPKNHLIHRKLVLILKHDDRFITNYHQNFIEIAIPYSDIIDIRKFNKLSKPGENDIIKTMRNEMWKDFDDFAIKCSVLELTTIVYSFIEDHNLSEDTFDMFYKHLQRLPENTEKIRKKVAGSAC